MLRSSVVVGPIRSAGHPINLTLHPTQRRRWNSTSSSPFHRIVSRRVYQQEHPSPPLPTKAVPATVTSTKPADKKPWPNSIKYPFYAVCSLAVPYTIAWVVASTPFLRNQLSKTQRDQLRRRFGDVDVHSLAYVDRNKAAPHYRLPGETSDWPHQQAIHDMLHEESIPIHVSVLLSSNDDMVVEESVHTVPASWSASQSQLGQLTRQRGFVAVDVVDDETGEKKKEEEYGIVPDDVVDSSTIKKDPLESAIAVYSSWYYQSPLTMSSSVARPERSVEELEMKIIELEAEMRNPLANRPYDDVLEEWNDTRGQLRRAKWLQFWRWR